MKFNAPALTVFGLSVKTVIFAVLVSGRLVPVYFKLCACDIAAKVKAPRIRAVVDVFMSLSLQVNCEQAASRRSTHCS